MTDTKTSAKRTAATDKRSERLTDEERAALKETVQERKRQTGESDLLAKIAEMPESDRVMAERIHAVVKASAPDLAPRTWYGMPAYAKDGKVVCFFRGGDVDGERYTSLGFSAEARLDDGNLWPTAYAVTEVTGADEKKIAALVKKAVG